MSDLPSHFPVKFQSGPPWKHYDYSVYVSYGHWHRRVGGVSHSLYLEDDGDYIYLECPDFIFNRKKAKKVDEIMLEFLKKAASKTAAKVAQAEVDDPEFAKKFPYLNAFMVSNVGADEKPRERSKVQVFCEGGNWKASLTDYDSKCSIFVTIEAPAEAFKALEKALAGDKPDWRRWKAQKGK
jgi:hypothetical protein